MRPEDRQLLSGDPRGHVQPPARQQSDSQDAVANIARTQLDSIYDGGAASAQPSIQSSDEVPTPYKRTHEPAHESHEQQWKQYHSSWQNYYQKYYEQYYMGAVEQVKNAYSTKREDTASSTDAFPLSGSDKEQTISKDEAVNDLREQIVEKVRSNSTKLRPSRHFIPVIASMAVLLLFVFLQYNSIIIGNVKAYVTPGEIDPQNIVVDPNSSLQVTSEPRLSIPKINVDVPVNYDTSADQASQLRAMENGVAYFGIPGANSKPGQVGNTVISGHSSNDFIDTGNYKFVFALLDRLKPGDIFYLNYQGIRYTYSVTKTRIVKPTDVSALVYPTTKPEVTLITCTPLGTALNRLLVTAEQVSPNPASAASAPATPQSSDKSAMPGNAPTIFERIFGG